MNGRLIYISTASLFGVLCSLKSFLLFFFLAVIYFFLLFKYKQFTRRQLMLLFAIFLLFYGSSLLAVKQNKSLSPATKSTFLLEFINDPKVDGDLLQIKAQDINTREKFLLHYQIVSEQEKMLLETASFYGRICEVSGSLKEPNKAKNENAFNYRQYLNRNSIFWLLTSKKNPLLNCSSKKANVLTMLKQLRYQGIHYLEQHFPPEVAALASALIYGDQSLIAPELLTNYRETGISHLLAISGLHVSLLVGMLYFIGIRLGVTRESMIVFILFFLPVYAVLTGGSPSVVRSVVMIFLVLAALKWKNRLKLLPIDALSIAFSVFLLLNPMVLFDVGFQLSFSVCAGIILSGPIIQRYQNNFTRMLATTVTAQLSALPFMLYHFFGVSGLSLFVNLIFIPLYSYLYLPGVYLLFLVQIIFGTVPSLMMTVFTKIVHFSNNMIELLSQYSFSDFTPGRPGPIFLIIDMAILLSIFILWEEKSRNRRGPVITVLCLTLLLLPAGWNRINPIGEVSVIDVGQGDSILIHLPYEKGNYLIDTGGTLQFAAESWEKRAKTFETGKDIVVPFLKGKGITRIDKLILTHGDIDHIGGAFAVLQELRVKQILMPAVTDRSETENRILKLAAKKGVQVEFVSAGDQWKRGNSSFVILSPEENFKGDRNRGSIVVLANIGGLQWFFGGDLDQQGEEDIVHKYPDILIDVLKVGHHGSKTSSSEVFLTHFKPKAALISVGEKNRFGHPHREVVEKLTKGGAVIFRTDMQGEIFYRFCFGKGTFFTFLP